eukprot:8863-Chlamydomonas_euryale.AAC.5
MAAPLLSSSVISTSSLLTAWIPRVLAVAATSFAMSLLASAYKGAELHETSSLMLSLLSKLEVSSSTWLPKLEAVLRSAVAAAGTVHNGNAYIIFRAICTGGPRRRPRRVLRLHKGVRKAQDAIFCASASR